MGVVLHLYFIEQRKVKLDQRSLMSYRFLNPAAAAYMDTTDQSSFSRFQG